MRPAPAIRRGYLDGTQPELAGRQVLIVDDNHTNRRIIRRQVESWHMQAHETALPSQALDRLQSGESFDVAILAVQMPEMDGLALAEEMRRQHDAETLPLVLLTSLGRQAIDNAVDAMDGEGEIRLRTRWVEPWVVVEIEDNGPGIPEAIQGQLFDPFFTTKAPGKGTGLGLNISHNIIVLKHGGHISVSSRSGKSVFRIQLPVCQPEAGEPAAF